jgi:hypothetical protein
MKATKVARKLRERIGRFSGDLSKGLCLPAQRFVSEGVYGIAAAQSVVLTEIGRTLEEPSSLHKTHDRLSRNLQREGLGEMVQRNVLALAAPQVQEDTLLILDPSDIAKKYARKMQFLGTVRDGSAHDFASGYWTLHVIGTQVGSSRMVPLYQQLWSSESPDFVSENEEILAAVDAVRAHTGNRGVWVIDRGGDRINLFKPLLERGARFLVRLRGDRHLVFNHKTLPAREVAQGCVCKHRKPVVRMRDGREERLELAFGFRRVSLPECPQTLYLLVIHGFGQEPLMLLTTEPLRASHRCLWYWVRAYTKRWAIEETIRYIKTSYDLENVRVLTYQALRNLMALLLGVLFFSACVLDHDMRLRVMAGYIERAAKRVFGVPNFKYYALADGLRALFVRHPGPPTTRISTKGPKQLALELAHPT